MHRKVSISSRRYLGSKAKLIPFIDKIVTEECKDIASVADIFGGTGNVAYLFSRKEIRVIINDILLSNKTAYDVWFGYEEIDINKMKNFIENYNSINISTDNYFSNNFSDTFFSRNNARKIGYIREDIESKFNEKLISKRERAYLITSLLYATDRIANTVGHYDAYIRGGKLDRDLDLPIIEDIELSNNIKNEIYCEDANTLVKKIKTDLVYIDPPYNSRQYSDAYHLLENLVRWDKPEVYGVAKKMDRTGLKSKYSMKQAPREFEKLINDIDAKYILVSYNNMGLKGAGRSQAKISDTEIMESLSKKGMTKIFEQDFSQFTTGKTNIKDHKERLFLCFVGKKELSDELTINNNKLVKSPLNYTGGKYKLLPQLLKYFHGFDTFIDLFGGGFNVGINSFSNHVIYNDKQKQVVRIIKLFQKYSALKIISKIESIIKEYGLSSSVDQGYDYYGCSSDKGLGAYNKEKFYQLRIKYNAINDSIERDFLLLTLIIFGFNNQIRFNADDKYNMPVGKRDLNNSVRQNIINFSQKAKSKEIVFYSKDFERIDIKESENPIIYCDPPYILGTATYNESSGWTSEDENRLLSYLKAVSQEGYKFALSNVIEHKGKKHENLITWCLENRFNINYVHSNYDNSNYQSTVKNHSTVEVLITNY